jgi:hypothetical protein
MIARLTGDRPAERWTVAACVLALCASVALLVLPIYARTTESAVTDATGEVTHTSTSSNETLLQGEGVGSIAILLLPVVIAAVPVVLKNDTRIRVWRTITAILLLLIVPIGYFTVGGFYLPSAVAMLIAATRRDPLGGQTA